MSNFNPEAFMQTQIEAQGETDYTPIPEGEYRALLKEVNAGTTPKGAPFLEVYWVIDDEEVRQLLDDDEPTVRQTLWLDIDDNGMLAIGKNKNIKLNRLRDALGQNTGKPWAPSMMEGNVAIVQVGHRLVDNAPFAEVKNVKAAS